MTDDSGIAARIREARNALKKTQAEMGEIAGVGMSTWRSYESGGPLPQSNSLQALCSLGVSGHWLLTGEGPMMYPIKSTEYFDEGLLEMIIEETELYIVERNLMWTPDKKARVFAAGYSMMAEEKGKSVAKATDTTVFKSLLKAAS